MPNTDDTLSRIAGNMCSVLGSMYCNKGIFVGDIKVSDYSAKTLDDLSDRYYPDTSKISVYKYNSKSTIILVRNNFTKINIKFNSDYNLGSEFIRTYQYTTNGDKTNIQSCYYGTLKMHNLYTPTEFKTKGVDYNVIPFTKCDIMDISINTDNKEITLYFGPTIDLSSFTKLNLFRGEITTVDNNFVQLNTTDYSKIDATNNTITIKYNYAIHATYLNECTSLSGYLYTWQDGSINMHSSNVTIASKTVNQYTTNNGYIYEIVVDKQAAPNRLKDSSYYKPEFYGFELPPGMNVSNMIIYKS